MTPVETFFVWLAAIAGTALICVGIFCGPADGFQGRGQS